MDFVGVLLVVLVVLVIAGIWFVGMRNGLVRLNVRVDEAWSDITVQLKRRADLIPNLIETVKGYAKHEAGVFENVTKARAATIAGPALADPAKAAAALSTANQLSTKLKGDASSDGSLDCPKGSYTATSDGNAYCTDV